jgi:CRISPR-associated endoribonuclease Cas6
MRLRIELNLRDQKLHINYKSKIQGLIYNMLKKDEKTTTLHDVGYRIENRPFKLFVFSDLVGRFVLDKKTKMMTFHSNAYFEISSYDELMIIDLVHFLQDHHQVILDQKVIDIVDFEIMNEPLTLTKESLVLSTISPVTVYQTDEKRINYFSPNDDMFIEKIMDNILKKYQAVGISPPISLPEIKIIDFKKRSVYFRKTFFIAYNLNLKVSNADKQFIKIILTTGLGSKNSMGFGMLRYEN